MPTTLKSCPSCGQQTADWCATCLQCGYRYSATTIPTAPDPVRHLARLKSYTGACVLVIVLYCFLWVPGAVANYLFVEDANRMEALAGEELPGAGTLRLMWHLTLWGAGIFLLFVFSTMLLGGC